MKVIANIYNQLIELFRMAAGVVVFTIFAMIVVDVLMRLGGLKPWVYISSTVEYGLLWFTMLAAPWLARIKGHVFIDAVTVLLPSSIQKVLAKVVYIICVAATGTIAVFSFELLLEAFSTRQMDPRGEDMPLSLLLFPIPLGFGFVAIEFMRYLVGIDDMYGKGAESREGV